MNAPTTATIYHCPDCDWKGTTEELGGLLHLHHIDQHISAGELVPAGTCPECRAMIEVDDADVPDYTISVAVRILSKRGWAITAPDECATHGYLQEGSIPTLADAVRDMLACYDKMAADPSYTLPWGTLRTAWAAHLEGITLPEIMRQITEQHGFAAVAAALANFGGVPLAINLLRNGSAKDGIEAAHMAGIHRTTLYRAKAWKAYEAAKKTKSHTNQENRHGC